MYSQHILFDAEGQPSGQTRQHIILPPPVARPKLHIVLPPPNIEPINEVFAEAMLEANSIHQRRNPLEWVASMSVHFAILAVLLLLPLYFTSGLDIQKFNLTFLLAPTAPAAAPPPAPLVSSAAARPVRSMPVRPYVAGKLTAPSFIPRAVVTTPGEALPPEVPMVGIPGGVPGGIPGGQLGGMVGGVPGGALNSVPPPPAPVAEGPKKPVLVGGTVKPPRLMFGPEPEYPVLARQSHISGVVVIEAIIDEHGNVIRMHAMSGHPLLIPAALEAVSKRKYEPTILDGEPTPIDLRVMITFNVTS